MLRTLTLIATAFALPALATAGPTDYRFDTVHTQILFSVGHLGFSHPTGRLHVKSGFIHFDEDDWSTAQVDATIDIASVDMGDAAWNDKLRSRAFFAVDRNPTARFVSVSVEKTGDKKGIVHGRLTLLGITHPLDLEVTFNRAGVDVYAFKRTVGFSATALLKRSDFSMKSYLPDVGDEVSLHIEVEGLHDRNAQEQSDPATGTPQPDSKEH